MIERGQVQPVVDKVYPLQNIAAAMSYLGTGHARGKIAIVMPG
jgi:NADPH:quinone reductase-like Zn-dependent oxidoreductase